MARLSEGRFLCVMRTQGEAENGEYRPLYACWSDAQGKTWSTPRPTTPQLMNIWLTLAVLDNGVVACEYMRPGFHVAFSTDGGQTWQDRVSFSEFHARGLTHRPSARGWRGTPGRTCRCVRTPNPRDCRPSF